MNRSVRWLHGPTDDYPESDVVPAVGGIATAAARDRQLRFVVSPTTATNDPLRADGWPGGVFDG